MKSLTPIGFALHIFFTVGLLKISGSGQDIKGRSQSSILVFLLLLVFFFPTKTQAQSYSWYKDVFSLVGSSGSYMNLMAESSDGSIFTAGEAYTGSNWLARLDEQGNVIHAGSLAIFNGYRLQGLVAGKARTVALVGNNGGFGSGTNGFFSVLDSTGNVWVNQSYPYANYGQLNFYYFEQIGANTFIAGGIQKDANNFERAFVQSFDSNYAGQWFKTYSPDTMRSEPVAFCEDELGGYFMVTKTGPFTGSGASFKESFRLMHLNGQGDSLWNRPVPTGFGSIKDILLTVDGDLLLTGAGDTSQTGACPSPLIEDKALLMRIDSTGNLQYSHTLGNCNISPFNNFALVGRRYSQQGISLYYDPLGNITWSGVINEKRLIVPSSPPWLDEFNLIHTFIAKLDSAGNFLFFHPASSGIYSKGYITEFIPTPSGDLIQIWAIAGGIDGINHIVRLSPFQPQPYWSSANLEVFYNYDTSGNCMPDGTPPMPEFVTELSPDLYPVNLSIGQVGYFQVPDDTFQVRMANTNPYWQQTCPANNGTQQAIIVNDTVVGINIGVEPIVSCPLLKADIGNSILRPCTPNQYDIRYQNLGSSSAINAIVTVDFDPLLTVLTSSIPWTGTPSGNTYQFQLGNLPVGTDTTFRVTTQVDCNTQIGQVVCNDVHITPDSFCLPNPIWDGASLEAEAWCNSTEDTVFFQVRNVGSGNMAIPGNILVLEDNVMRHNFPMAINAGQDTTFWSLATGGTWYIQAEQSPGHPGSTFAADVLEACGTDSTGNFTIGYAATVPLSNWEYYHASRCDEVIASYDPNDKRGFPLGTGPDHYIDSTTMINYVIRFQNTGNDTAFNILVVDTLPAEVDGSTFQPGSYSHPYTLTFGPGGSVYFHFPHINLPDSTTNEPASHGYIQFQIRQVDGNLPGTIITNDAEIYFDFNEPIVTDDYFHTIEPDWYSGTVSIDQSVPSIGLKAGPNPFRETIRFRLDETPLNPGHFELFDVQGTIIQSRTVSSAEWQVNGAGLASGIYFFRYADGEGRVVSGRIVRFGE